MVNLHPYRHRASMGSSKRRPRHRTDSLRLRLDKCSRRLSGRRRRRRARRKLLPLLQHRHLPHPKARRKAHRRHKLRPPRLVLHRLCSGRAVSRKGSG